MGKASGVQSTLQRFGSAFGVAIATAVFATNGGLATPLAFTAGFRPALAIVASLSFVGALSALAVARPSFNRAQTTRAGASLAIAPARALGPC